MRTLFQQAIPDETAQFDDQVPKLGDFYVPGAHARALDPDNMLVEGIRGAGKSVWWAALQDASHRQLISNILPRNELTPKLYTVNRDYCEYFHRENSDS